MKIKPIKQVIQTLRGGDLIMSSCEACGEHKVMVLSRNSSGEYELSPQAPEIVLLADPNGPYRWDSTASTFIGKDRKHHRHISEKSRVVDGGALTELGWYESLPKTGDAPFFIDKAKLQRDIPSPFLAQLTGLLNRMELGEEGDRFAEMQLAVKLALGGAEIDEIQMKKLVLLMKFMRDLGQQTHSLLAGLGSFGAMLASMVLDGEGADQDLFGGQGHRPHRRTAAPQY